MSDNVYKDSLARLGVDELVDNLTHVFARLIRKEPAVFMDTGLTDMNLLASGTEILSEHYKTTPKLLDDVSVNKAFSDALRAQDGKEQGNMIVALASVVKSLPSQKP